MENPSPPASPPTDQFRDRFYARLFAVATVLLLGLACFRIIEPFLGPLLWATFFAFLLSPAHTTLTRKLRDRADYSALLLTLVTLIALIGPLAALSAAFIYQANSLLQYIQRLLTDPTRNDLQQFTQHPQLQALWPWLEHTLGISIEQVRNWAGEATRSLLQSFAALSGRLFLGVIGSVANLGLTVFLLFFFIRDGGLMLTVIRDLIPMQADKRHTLFNHLSAITRAVVFGTGLTALLQGMLVSIAFVIVGLPSPLVFGVLAALLALLPFVGTALIWLPAAGLLMTQDRWLAGFFMLAWGALLVSMIDNLLKPLLISGRAEVATLTVFIGVLGGVNAFGAIGLFMGPVVLALAVALIQFAVEAQRSATATASSSHSN